MLSFEVAIIGAGPSGLVAANVLKSFGRSVVIFEKGDDIYARNHAVPTTVSSGVGGGGLFSDGKLSFWPSASKLSESYSSSSLAYAEKKIRSILEKIGIQIPYSFTGDIYNLPIQECDKRYPSVQLSTYERYALLYSLVNPVQECIKTDCKIKDIRRENGAFCLVDDNNDEYIASKVLVSAGRYAFADDLQIPVRLDETILEFGIRVEMESDQMPITIEPYIDYKHIIPYDDFEIRTFCYCQNGIVLESNVGDITTFNGSSIDFDTNKSNIGILIRTRNLASDIGREYVDFCNKPRPIESPFRLEDYCDSDLEVFGSTVDKLLKEALRQILPNSQSGLIYYPEIEHIGNYPKIGQLENADGKIYFSGDASGAFRGLSAALISGAACGYCINEHIKEEISQRFSDVDVNKSHINPLELIFTAQSKKFFYCRDAICEFVINQGCLPINPFRVFDYFLGDRVDRDLIRRGNNQLIRSCNELWVFGPIANGILFEIMLAKLSGKPVRFFTISTHSNEIEEIKEVYYGNLSRVKFEPEVHAAGISKENLFRSILNINHISPQLNLFDYYDLWRDLDEE